MHRSAGGAPARADVDPVRAPLAAPGGAAASASAAVACQVYVHVRSLDAGETDGTARVEGLSACAGSGVTTQLTLSLYQEGIQIASQACTLGDVACNFDAPYVHVATEGSTTTLTGEAIAQWTLASPNTWTEVTPLLCTSGAAGTATATCHADADFNNAGYIPVDFSPDDLQSASESEVIIFSLSDEPNPGPEDVNLATFGCTAASKPYRAGNHIDMLASTFCTAPVEFMRIEADLYRNNVHVQPATVQCTAPYVCLNPAPSGVTMAQPYSCGRYCDATWRLDSEHVIWVPVLGALFWDARKASTGELCDYAVGPTTVADLVLDRWTCNLSATLVTISPL